MALIAFAGVLSSCAPYYSTQVKLSASLEQTESALSVAASNLSDLSLIADAATITDSSTFEMRYVGLRATTSLTAGVHSTPRIGVRLHPIDSANTIMAVTSVGKDRLANVFVTATEEELAQRGMIAKDSLHIPNGGMSGKSSAFHQFLNLLNPGIAQGYVMFDNPYYTMSDLWEPFFVGALDIGALAMTIPAAKHVIANNATRPQQYQFVLGVIISSVLRYIYGVDGMISIHQYNELAQSPYYLGASYINSRISSIGVSVRLP